MSFGSTSHTSEPCLANGFGVGRREKDILEANLLSTPGQTTSLLFSDESIHSTTCTTELIKILRCHPEPLDTCEHLPIMSQLGRRDYEPWHGRVQCLHLHPHYLWRLSGSIFLSMRRGLSRR
ncbi:hypothetical protein CDAR_289711 [Caerostris darwini]|uniref:Uncharacterized protein n=1 Tax=Caerostris darwini TaxID=1538125 RepID=A0AAV4WWP8_9ARAC|nr:hypothetical protein CDAR_289711 [Caerostris darwini]